jgi:hypothetical protein
LLVGTGDARPVGAGAAAGGQASASAGGGQAASQGNSPLGGLGNTLSTKYDSKVYVYKTQAGDMVGDGIVDNADEAVSPGFDAAVGGATKVLPPFLANHVPWLANYGKFMAVNNAKDALGSTVEGSVESAAMSVKPGGGGKGPGGGKGSGNGPSASARRVASDAAPQPGVSAGNGASGNGSSGNAAAGTAAATPATVSPVSGSWTIRLGRFAAVANADSFATDLGARGIPARVTIANDGGRYWSFVDTGNYPQRGKAESALNRLMARGYGGKVVSDSRGGGL